MTHVSVAELQMQPLAQALASISHVSTLPKNDKVRYFFVDGEE